MLFTIQQKRLWLSVFGYFTNCCLAQITSNSSTSTLSECTAFSTITVAYLGWASAAVTTTVTYRNVTVYPQVTPYSNGTNITNYITITNTRPPVLSAQSTVISGTTCIAPTPCIIGGKEPATCEVTVTSAGPTQPLLASTLVGVPWTEPESFLPTVIEEPSSPPGTSTSTLLPGGGATRTSPPPVAIITSTNEQLTPISSAEPILSPQPDPTFNRETTARQESETTQIQSQAQQPPDVSHTDPSLTPAIVTVWGAGLPSGVSTLPSGSGLLLPNGQTLLPGSGTTMGNTVISLFPSQPVVVVEGITVSLAAPGPQTAAPGSVGPGDFIWSGLGGLGPTTTYPLGGANTASVYPSQGSNTTSPYPPEYTGMARKRFEPLQIWIFVAAGLLEAWVM